jgi:CheY-like chemotaxis protein
MNPKSLQILIAEDNVVFGDVIRFNLERAGFSVALARNGTEALQKLSTEEFDLLITDHEMPGIKGEELCRIVREELNIRSMKIVMCSAKGLELDRDMLNVRYGIATVLFKPFSMRELTSLASRLIKEENSTSVQAELQKADSY